MPTATTSAELSRPQPTAILGQNKAKGESSQPKQAGPAAQGIDAVRMCAYFKWIEAGMPQGDGVSFWLAAEKQLAKA